MPNLFRLSTALLFIMNFSGKPLPFVAENHTAFPVFEKELERKEDAEYIPWLEERMLTWEDFQSTPKRYTDAVASTSTSLGVAYQLRNGKLTYQITCNFSKKKSWGLLKTDYILAHEQAHFDITEIYARKLHQALQRYWFDRRSFKQDINHIYQQIVKEKESIQEAYDGESDHSRNKKRQIEWLEKIDVMLEETYPFSNYP